MKFKIHYDGIDGRFTRKYATLQEAAQYIWDRWQGCEYMDGTHAFHTDYVNYTTEGFALSDIYTFTEVPIWSGSSKTCTEATRKVIV